MVLNRNDLYIEVMTMVKVTSISREVKTLYAGSDIVDVKVSNYIYFIHFIIVLEGRKTDHKLTVETTEHITFERAEEMVMEQLQLIIDMFNKM